MISLLRSSITRINKLSHLYKGYIIIREAVYIVSYSYKGSLTQEAVDIGAIEIRSR